MKKVISLTSLAGIVLGLLWLGWLYSVEIPAPIDEARGAPASASLASFPIGRSVPVELEIGSDLRAQLSAREGRDQALDWLLLVILNDLGLTDRQLAEATYDLPPVRYGYMRAVAGFEYGKTRSRFVGDGRVVALIPAGSTPEERIDHLAAVFDEHRKNLGEAPVRLVVFEYELDLAREVARIVRGPDVNGGDLATEAYGYHEARITNAGELAALLNRVSDVTLARVDGDALVVGGRKLASRPYKGIRTEDVAALWQAEQKLQARLDGLERQWKSRSAALYAQAQASGWTQSMYDREAQELRKRFHAEQVPGDLVFGTGFSLDPSYDFAKLSAEFARVEPVLAGIVANPDAPISRADIQRAKAGIAARDPVPFLRLVEKLSSERKGGLGGFADSLKELDRDAQYQSARYDGDLKGTEVGMVLFYTDLLAKLWLFDFMGGTPEMAIPDFRPGTRVVVSPVFRREITELPSTRLWFGPSDKGFQVGSSGRDLLLARNATRVFAASSNPLEPGKEVAAAAPPEAFLGWWNDHYEEVARFEPEYERLNEIMKWSLIISWLGSREDAGKLGFLGAVPVRRDAWFPDWARQQKHLRFSAWDRLPFLPKNVGLSENESLRLVRSGMFFRFGEPRQFSGGVSLAPKQLFEKRALFTRDTSTFVRRSNLDYVGTGRGQIRTFDGLEYKFTDPRRNGFSVVATPKEGTKLRSRIGEVGRVANERVFERSAGELRITTTHGRTQIGQFAVAKTANGFRAGWTSRDLDAVHSLARRLSRTEEDLAWAVANDPAVDTVLSFPSRGEVVVRLKNGDGWVKLAPETKPSAMLAEGWNARVADPARGVRNIQIAPIEHKALLSQIGDDAVLALEPATPAGKSIFRVQSARGPPDAKTVELAFGELKITGALDPRNGLRYFEWRELPAAVRADPAGFARVASTGQTGGASAPRTPLAGELRARDYRAAAELIAEAPAKMQADLRATLNAGLRRNAELLRSRQYVEAIQQITELERVFGRVPELQLRKGLAQLERGKPELAAEALADVKPGRFHGGDAFSREVNWRIRSGDSRAARDDLRRIQSFGEWLHAKGSGKAADDRLSIAFKDHRLELQLHLKDRLPAGSAADDPARAVERGDTLVYVQDRPGLNNLDWNASVGRSLSQAGELGRVVRLTHADIAAFQPDTVFVLSTPGVKLQLRVKPSSTSVLRGGVHAGSGECDPSVDPGCPKPVTSAGAPEVLMVVAGGA